VCGGGLVGARAFVGRGGDWWRGRAVGRRAWHAPGERRERAASCSAAIAGLCQGAAPARFPTVRLAPPLCPAGQYNDAAYSVVQLRKIVADSRAKRSQQQPGYYGYQPQQQQQHEDDEPEVRQLAEACARCEQELDEARRRPPWGGQGRARAMAAAAARPCHAVQLQRGAARPSHQRAA
jgi:hypothetical protein